MPSIHTGAVVTFGSLLGAGCFQAHNLRTKSRESQVGVLGGSRGSALIGGHGKSTKAAVTKGIANIWPEGLLHESMGSGYMARWSCGGVEVHVTEVA